ncbi:hypothetical protein D3C73_1445150 [compost metagenome]
MVFPARAALVRATVGDHENERLFPALGAGAHHLHDHVGLVLVHFVDQRHVWPRTRLTIVRADRSEKRSRLEISQVPDVLPGAAAD